MPYLNVRIAAPKSKETAKKVSDFLTGLAVISLGKVKDVVSVDVQFTDQDSWFVGGQPIANQKKATFFIEINVTTGTNTRGEKADFIKKAYDGMTEILGDTTPTSYIITKNVDPDDWGFGGLTQGYRYIEDKIK